MLTSKAKLLAKATTKLGLATTVAALCMAAAPFVGAAAAAPPGYSIGAARAAALQECSALADERGYAYRSCMAQHGEQE